MNTFEQQLNSLRIEHKLTMRAIREQYDARAKEIRSHIRTAASTRGMETFVDQLKDLLRLTTADRDRRLSKAGRTYHFRNKTITAEMRAFYTAPAV